MKETGPDTLTNCRDSEVFVKSVSAIFEYARKDNLELQQVRDVLKYLLLRRHPDTQEEILLNYPPAEIAPERIEHLRVVARRTLEDCLEGRSMKPYALLQLILDVSSNLRARWVSQEETTLLTISLWALSQQLKPRSLCTLQACLRIYQRSFDHKPVGFESEFISDYTRGISWVAGSISELFESGLPMEYILPELSYLGAFISLVKASRMLPEDENLKQFLCNEVAWINQQRQSCGSKFKCSRLQTLTKKLANVFTDRQKLHP